MATPLRLSPDAQTDSKQSATEVPAAKRRAPRSVWIFGILVLVAAVWGTTYYLRTRNLVTTDNAQVEARIAPIASRVQAFVTEVRVDDDQTVKAGDTLLVLDDRDLRLRLRQAEAELAAALGVIGGPQGTGQAQAQLQWSQDAAASATAAVASAEATERKAAADLARYKGLAEKQIISPQQLDAAQAAYDAAKANLESLRRSATASGSQVTAYSAATRIALARLAAAQTAVDNARLQLSYTVITAPTDGIIAKRNVESGMLVQIGQGLMSLVPANEIWVTANMKETQVGNVAVGDPATFTVDAYPGRTFTGHVMSLSPATGAKFALLPPDNATGNFTKVVQRVPVRIAVDGPADPARPLRPGMSVIVTVKTK
ncbi:MAG TPA: HlyD family secretion protein [Gemmatimonadales bacterium]|jgi:membrane fusion protein (multidrug efflux system)|nr:HlyD family secretion protein [Gemmatimonadales bacterium]